VIWEEYEAQDPLKYDSFIRTLKGRYERMYGYDYIKAYALSEDTRDE
jgi:hypothetical protein